MTTRQIEDLVRQGRLTQVFSDKPNCCASEELWNAFLASGATKFANFAYTDYGSLHGNTAFDCYMIRILENTYKNEDGILVECSGFGGRNCLVYGKALERLIEESCGGEENLNALLWGLEDSLDYCRQLAIREHTEWLIDSVEDYKDADFDVLRNCVWDCDSRMDTNGRPDYSDRELLAQYKAAIA